MNLQDTPQSILEQYGVDLKEGMNPNPFQALLISEAELGSVSKEELEKSIIQ
jgi:hypothetical protein